MIKFGIVGLGGIAHKFASDIKYAKNAKLIAVASRDIEKAEVFSKQYDVGNFYGSYEDLLQSDIDAVYIATPHHVHLENSLLFIRNNKHVLCEKPITISETELDVLITAAREHNVLLMEAMWTRFLPAMKKVKELVKSTDFNEMHLNFGYQLHQDYPKEGRLLNPYLAAGTTLDLGVYPVSIMTYLTNLDIKSITAKAVMNEDNIDMDIKVEVTFVNNKKAYLHASMLENLDTNSYIQTNQGVITIHNTHSTESFTFDKEYHYPYQGEGFECQIDAFAQTIEEGKLENNVMSYRENKKVMSILDEIRRQIGLVYPFE